MKKQKFLQCEQYSNMVALNLRIFAPFSLPFCLIFNVSLNLNCFHYILDGCFHLINLNKLPAENYSINLQLYTVYKRLTGEES